MYSTARRAALALGGARQSPLHQRTSPVPPPPARLLLWPQVIQKLVFPFSRMNYRPSNHSELFPKLEAILEQKAGSSPLATVNILMSMFQLSHFPQSVLHQVFSPAFITNVMSTSGSSQGKPGSWGTAGRRRLRMGRCGPPRGAVRVVLGGEGQPRPPPAAHPSCRQSLRAHRAPLPLSAGCCCGVGVP